LSGILFTKHLSDALDYRVFGSISTDHASDSPREAASTVYCDCAFCAVRAVVRERERQS